MNKKFIALSTIFLIIIANFIMMNNTATAVSTDEYSMDVPSSYKGAGKNAWIIESGDNVNIQIKASDGAKVKGSLDKALKELLDETAALDIYSSVETKEVGKFTKNKYKGIHIVAKLKQYPAYVEQYAFISDKNVYVITFTSKSKDYFSSDDVKSMINSFTIPNYKEPKSDSVIGKVLIGAAIGAVIGAAFYGVNVIKKKKAE